MSSLSNQTKFYKKNSTAGPGLVVGFNRDVVFGDTVVLKPWLKAGNATVVMTDPELSEYLHISGVWMASRDIPLDVNHHTVGEGSHKRDVYVFDIPKHINLRAGLTVHSGFGTWSSWPMHTFEAKAVSSPANVYPEFDEMFAFVTDPVGGWGIQTVTSRHSSYTVAVADREIVSVPLSFHPVVASPDTRLAYFWAYTNGGEKFTKEGRI